MTELSTHHLTDVVEKLAAHLGLDCHVVVTQEQTGRAPLTHVAVTTSADAKFLIGKNGQNLRALEQVLRAVQMRVDPAGANIRVDVNDYRRQRMDALVTSVHQIAQRVRNSGQSEALDPMDAAERRVVHTELAVYSELATESVGEEPRRRVVVRLI